MNCSADGAAVDGDGGPEGGPGGVVIDVGGEGGPEGGEGDAAIVVEGVC